MINKLFLNVKYLFKSLLIGICLGVVIIIIMLLIGLLYYKGDIVKAMILCRTVLIIVGSLGILVSAALFIKKENLRSFNHQEEWEKHFGSVHFTYIILLLFSGVIIMCGIPDYFIFKII